MRHTPKNKKRKRKSIETNSEMMMAHVLELVGKDFKHCYNSPYIR
jgi:hypothetical protein